MAIRHYYALSDSFSGDDPKEYTYGFANSTKVIAFKSKEDRDIWLKTTKLLKAKALTRAESLRMTTTVNGRKLVPVYGSNDYVHVVLWESKYT